MQILGEMKVCNSKKILLISMDIVGVFEDCEKEIFQDVVQVVLFI